MRGVQRQRVEGWDSRRGGVCKAWVRAGSHHSSSVSKCLLVSIRISTRGQKVDRFGPEWGGRIQISGWDSLGW